MAASEASTGSSTPILIIDDEEVVRLLFQSLLEPEGYRVLLAETGRQGAQLLDQHRPPLALVDKNLPDVSGLELIAQQKTRHPDTEFIVITGYASLDSAVKALEMGAFSYLTKPFSDMDMVMDRIRAALEVNHLRFETSQLRDRLTTLSAGPPQPEAVAQGAGAQIGAQIQHTIEFLQSFLDKRDLPPSASLWARTVDMAEEEIRRLKGLLPPRGQG
ncbi:MAG TPA: response regulator [Myxococcota bacterium]|nr:response regulator [Myxococcota bacterium]HRY95705.1 response regulator [Myxococcota bacterium]HSA21800.1 response regulator [Myxococcota bacterium]